MNALSIIIPGGSQSLLTTGVENKMAVTKKAEPKKTEPKKAEPKKMNATKPAAKPVANSVPKSKK